MGRQEIWKKIRPKHVLFGMLLLLTVVYMTMQVVQVLSTTVTTTKAEYIKMDESIPAEGWFIRDETIAEGTSSSTVKHIVNNGDKVQASAALAIVYADQSIMDASRRLEEIEQELNLLQTAVQSVDQYNITDYATLDQQIGRQMEQLAQQVQDGMPTGAAETAASLRQLFLRRSGESLDIAALQSQIALLKAEQTTLSGQAYGRSQTIRAPVSGYFSEVVDGYESILTLQAVQDMTPQAFATVTAQKPTAPKGKLGKVVNGFHWYFATVLPREQAERLKVGQEVTLKFSQIATDALATVTHINAGEGESLVLFSSSVMNGELVSMRQQKVDIVLKSYAGLKVPLSAITMEKPTEELSDNQIGVYILTGSTPRFKRITPIYKGEEFYIVEKGNRSNELVQGDNIITQATGLQDLKVMR